MATRLQDVQQAFLNLVDERHVSVHKGRRQHSAQFVGLWEHFGVAVINVFEQELSSLIIIIAP